MSTHDLCTIVSNLAQHADRIDNVGDVLDMLQQCFLSVFRKLELLPLERDDNSAAALESNEESKLKLVNAVYMFHTVGAARHAHFFENASYNPHSALFIHELLGALSSNSSVWFRALQLDSLRACVAILQAIGWRNVRLCLPGIVSATVQYIHRAHTRKDVRAVRCAAIELLHCALSIAFSTSEDAAWMNMASTRLPHVMHDILDTAKLLECGLDERAAAALQRTIADLIRSPGLAIRVEVARNNDGDGGGGAASAFQSTHEHVSSVLSPKVHFAQLLSVTCCVLANLVHLAQLNMSDAAHAKTSVPSTQEKATHSCCSAYIPRAPSTCSPGHVHERGGSGGSSSSSSSTRTGANTNDNHDGCCGGDCHSECSLTSSRDAVVYDVIAQVGKSSLRRALMQLRGVDLLHLATTLVRVPVLRPVLFSMRPDGNNSDAHEESSNVALFLSIVRRCVRLVAKTMSEDVVYTDRAPRPYPSGVVDEFLECLAHALTEESSRELAGMGCADESTRHKGNQTEPMNSDTKDTQPTDYGEGEEEQDEPISTSEVFIDALIHNAETVLGDWEQYALHPSTVYVFGRIFVWMFKPVHTQHEVRTYTTREGHNTMTHHKDCTATRAESALCSTPCPLPWEFISSGAFAQLWSVLGQSHLWNITAHEELCTVAQVRHRQCVAATILRLLSLIASDVMSHCAVAATGTCPFHGSSTGRDTQDGGSFVSHANSVDARCTLASPAPHSRRLPTNCLANTLRNSCTGIDATTAAEASHSIQRFFTLVVYLVMEKAATSGVVHESAVQCLQTFARVAATISGGGDVDFVLHVGAHLVDEASRAVKVSFTRLSAAAVLRGAVTFLSHALSSQDRDVPSRGVCLAMKATSDEVSVLDSSSRRHTVATDIDTTTDDNDSRRNGDSIRGGSSIQYDFSSLSVVTLIKQRLSPLHVQRWVYHRQSQLTPTRVEQLADFLAAAVTVATESCAWVRREGCADVESVRGMRAILSLLQDSFHLAALLNFACPLKPLDELNDTGGGGSRSISSEGRDASACQTTSWHARVRLLQIHTLRAMHEVLLCCSSNDATCHAAVPTLITGLTVFLTTNEAVAVGAEMAARAEEQQQQLRDEQNTERRAKENEHDTARVNSAMREGVAWWPVWRDEHTQRPACQARKSTDDASTQKKTSVDENDTPTSDSGTLSGSQRRIEQTCGDDVHGSRPNEMVIQLPRGHLKTVYRIYLSLFAMLREPVARFTTFASSSSASARACGNRTGSRRSAVEQREMDHAVPITPGVFALLQGFEALLLLAHDFLITRMVEEVLPLVLVWHERSVIPRVPTARSLRLTQATREFAEMVMRRCASRQLRRQARHMCAPFFDLSSLKTDAPDDKSGILVASDAQAANDKDSDTDKAAADAPSCTAVHNSS